MRRSLLLILSLVLVVLGLMALSACPKTETEPGSGIQQVGGGEIPPGTPATTAPEEPVEPGEGVEPAEGEDVEEAAEPAEEAAEEAAEPDEAAEGEETG